MKRILTISTVVALLGALMLPVGCGNGSFTSGDQLDWVSLMTCGNTQQASEGDLQFLDLQITALGQRPGDRVDVRITIINNAPIAAGANGNISLASNVRMFLSLDNALDQNDYLCGEYVLPGMFAGRVVVVSDTFVIPRATQPPPAPFQAQFFPVVFPDPNPVKPTGYNPRDPTRPEYIGPVNIAYFVICVLDSQNCVLEANSQAVSEPLTREDQRGAGLAAFPTTAIGTYLPNSVDANGRLFNNQARTNGQLTVTNPNLPNLQIKFNDRQPTGDLSQQGGFIITVWEIINSGVGLVDAGTLYGLRVHFSENEAYNNWDRNIITNNPVLQPGTYNVGRDATAHNRGDIGRCAPHTPASASLDDSVMFDGDGRGGSLFGNANTLLTVMCQLPYLKNSGDTYNGFFSSVQSWAATTPNSPNPPAAGGVLSDEYSRTPPPTPTSLNYLVYCPVPTNENVKNFLLGEVDSTNTVTEAVENDNRSTNFEGANGELGVQGVTANNQGPEEITPVDLAAQARDIFNGQGVRVGWELVLTLNYDCLTDLRVSVGWYFSIDANGHSSDYMCERFWYDFLQGRNQLNSRFTPNNIPAAGEYYVMAVVDDIFRWKEILEDDNFKVSVNTINIQP